MQNFMTTAQEVLHLLSSKHTQVLPVKHLCIIPSFPVTTTLWATRISIDTLFCDHDNHSHLWTVTIDCDHYEWPVLKIFVTIIDHSWTYVTIHDWLIMVTMLLVKVFPQTIRNIFLKYFIFFFFQTYKSFTIKRPKMIDNVCPVCSLN